MFNPRRNELSTHPSSHSYLLDNIRAIAALLVVFYHYAIFFFIAQTFCATLSCSPPLEEGSHWPFVQTLSTSPFDLGQFAVGFFFFLSGFLLPGLRERYPTRSTFFRNRFFRLWPVYVIGLLINILFIKGASLYYGIDFPHTTHHVMASFLCLRPFLNYPYITGVVWTFEIEVFFILFCILLYSRLKPLSPHLLYAQLAFFLIPYLCKEVIVPDDSSLVFQFCLFFTTKMKFVALIFMGTYLNAFLHKQLTPLRFLLSQGFLVTLFIGECYLLLGETTFIRYLVSYSLSTAVFFSLLFLDQKRCCVLSKKSSVLGFVAEISFPLYLVHAVPGYVIAYIMHSNGLSIFVGLFLGFLLTFPLAIALHSFIEKPFRDRWSKGLS